MHGICREICFIAWFCDTYQDFIRQGKYVFRCEESTRNVEEKYYKQTLEHTIARARAHTLNHCIFIGCEQAVFGPKPPRPANERESEYISGIEYGKLRANAEKNEGKINCVKWHKVVINNNSLAYTVTARARTLAGTKDPGEGHSFIFSIISTLGNNWGEIMHHIIFIILTQGCECVCARTIMMKNELGL